MEDDVRPAPGLAGAWDETARLYGRGFRPLIVVALLPAFVGPSLVNLGAERGWAVSAALAVAAVSLGLVGPGALVSAASDARHDRPSSVRRAYLASLTRLVSIVGAALIVGLALIIPLAIVAAIFVRGETPDARDVIVLVAAAFLLTFRFQLALPAIVLGRVGAWQALGRSWTLSKRGSVRFLPFAFLVACSEILPSTLEGVRPRGAAAFVAVGIVAAIVTPVGATALAVAYERLVDRRSLDDLSWLPAPELETFAATAAARAAAGADQRDRWRPQWTHLLLLPLAVGVLGIVLGDEWGTVVFLVSLPFALAYGLFRLIGRLLRD